MTEYWVHIVRHGLTINGDERKFKVWAACESMAQVAAEVVVFQDYSGWEIRDIEHCIYQD